MVDLVSFREPSIEEVPVVMSECRGGPSKQEYYG